MVSRLTCVASVMLVLVALAACQSSVGKRLSGAGGTYTVHGPATRAIFDQRFAEQRAGDLGVTSEERSLDAALASLPAAQRRDLEQDRLLGWRVYASGIDMNAQLGLYGTGDAIWLNFGQKRPARWRLNGGRLELFILPREFNSNRDCEVRTERCLKRLEKVIEAKPAIGTFDDGLLYLESERPGEEPLVIVMIKR